MNEPFGAESPSDDPLRRAAEAMRALSGSARLVSTIGTRAPSTMPAAVAPAK